MTDTSTVDRGVHAEPEVVHHLLAGASLGVWLGEMITDRRGQTPPVPEGLTVDEVLELIMQLPPADRIVLHSVHATLQRDAAVGVAAAPIELAVLAQTPTAAALGHDKRAQRQAMQRVPLPMPPLARAPYLSKDEPVVLKPRDGTEGLRNQLGSARTTVSESEVAELFVFGEEYSVNLYVDGARETTLPPVWKGSTRLDLLPPWNRRRVCRRLDSEQLDATLRQVACAAARACEAVGFVEVELVVEAATGQVMVLEVNPRVSGTLRIAAMAARWQALDLVVRTSPWAIQARDVAIEVPYSGPARCDLAGGVVATSRLTVAAATVEAAERKLEDELAAGRA